MAVKQNLGSQAPDGSIYITMTDGAGNLGSTVLITETGPATGTQTSVASSASDVTILASNASRKSASVYNDSTQILYLLCAAGTSSTTNYTVQIVAGGFFELAPGRDGVYTGIIKGIWASANGNARVTEWT